MADRVIGDRGVRSGTSPRRSDQLALLRGSPFRFAWLIFATDRAQERAALHNYISREEA
jgi:hypothetical protein